MKKIQNIMFPVDLSEISSQLVPYVRDFAEKYGANIHMLFVARAFDYFSGYNVAPSSIITFHDEIVEGTEKSLQAFKERYFADLPETRVGVEIGDIPDKILDYIEAHDIDLLIMGTHGRKGLNKVFFGSVAERVSKFATVPVLLVNPYRIRKETAD